MAENISLVIVTNETEPHISELYCLDRTFLDQTLGGSTFAYARAITDLVLTVLLITVNIILIVAISMFRRRYRGTSKVYNSGASMKFVQVLAFSDVLVGLTGPVYLIPHYFCGVNDVMRVNVYMCMMKYVGTVFASVMSNMSLLSIAVDRYMAVEYTIKYRLIMTHRVCHIMILGQTIFSLVSSIVLFFWNSWTPETYCDLEDVVPHAYVIALGTVCHSTILVAVIGVHYKMHQKAAECASRRHIMELGVSRVNYSTIKSAKVVILVTGVYIICWTPYSICLMVRMMMDVYSPLFDFFFQLMFPLSYANSLINPFIYAWKNTEIQNALMWSLRRASLSSTQ